MIQLATNSYYYNHDTGETRPAPIEDVARKHYINQKLLARWVKGHEVISALPEGRCRLRKNVLPQDRSNVQEASDQDDCQLPPTPIEVVDKQLIQEDPETSDEPILSDEDLYKFLEWNFRDLRQIGLLTMSDLDKVDDFHCPVPFISRPFKFKDAYSYEEAYTIAGYPMHQIHQGHPPCPSSEVPYDGKVAIGKTAHEVNKELYNMAPEHESRAPQGKKDVIGSYDSLQECVALVCQRLLSSSDKVVEVLPVRIELDYNHPYEGAPTQWALLLTSHEGCKVLVPLALSLCGPSTTDVTLSSLIYTKGWTIDLEAYEAARPCKRKVDHYDALKAIFQAFERSIVLHVQDTEMISNRKEGKWRIRKYVCAWKLYKCPIQTTWHQQKKALSPVEGTYINLDCLVNKMLEIGCQVRLAIAVDRPFRLLRLSDFCLITHYDQHEEYSPLLQRMIDIKRKKPGSRSKNATPSENKRAKKIHKAEIRSLENALQRGDQLVDGEPCCQFPSCPFPHHLQFRYCKYHVEPMLQIFRRSQSKPTAKLLDTSVWKHEVPTPKDVRAELEVLRRYNDHELEDLWVVDFEFTSVPHYSPVPTQMAIRLLNDDLLLNTNVHYNMSLTEYILALLQVAASESEDW